MKLIQMIWPVLMALIPAVSSCSGNDAEQQEWPWTDPEPEPESEMEAKPRFMWIDASANFPFFADDKERIASDLKKISDIGFTDIVVDVRPTEGTVLFKSETAPAADRLAAWVDGEYRMIRRTADFDYLQAFIDAGHKLGLRVHASMNTFVGGYGGYYGLESVGPIFTGDIPASWATRINSENGIVSTFYDGVSDAVFLNPNSPDVQEYVLKIIRELAGYDVDGIILDRCRYDDNGLMCEFSDISRSAFEKYLGKSVSSWPGGVFPPGTASLPSNLSLTQKSWLAFRAKSIHDFIVKASETVHSVRSDIRFAVYVGAWYSTYYESGVNWASPKYRTSDHYGWASYDYASYGFADHCDCIYIGCYAEPGSVYGRTEWTMQGFASLGKELMCGDTPCYGGPDVGNPGSFADGGQQAVIPSTVDAIINASDGYFVFDLCHVRSFDYWNALRQGINNYLNSLN